MSRPRKAPVQGSLALSRERDAGVLEGEVARVTFENDATGFRVLKVDTEGGEQQTVVGIFPKAPPGTRIRATGKRIKDPKHGEQFKADTLLALAPSTLDGLRRYLASGLVKGIGAAFAKRIVDTFGESTLHVLDHEAERLSEVPGLGRSRIGSIAKAWAQHRDVGAIMVFLQSHGASPALAARIYKRFGKDAIHVVSKNPYRLALDVWGIGFLTADQIARSIGVGAESPERAQAGVLHTLHAFAGRGDVYAERVDLIERAGEMLQCDTTLVEQAVAALHRDGRLWLEELIDGTTAVYTPELRDAEARVAERLGVLLGQATQLEHVEHAMNDFQRMTGLQLAKAQRHAVMQAAAHKVLVITGGPGVGKTTIVQAILALYDAARVKFELAAPTGRAAKRMSEATGRDASTIHRLLEFDPRTGTFQKNLADPLALDAVIVDETSMVPIELMDSLLCALPEHARLVLVGDVDQLPSVGPGAVLRDIIASGRVPKVELKEIFRQAAGSSIVTNAHRIHDGEAPIGAKQKGEQFYIIERSSPDKALEVLEELMSHRIASSFGLDPVEDVQVLTPMQRGPIGAIALNEMLQGLLNPPERDRAEVKRGNRILRLGDKVMQLRNNYDKDVFNGDIGRITAVDPQERTIEVRYDARFVDYAEGELDELSLAYATSIHKGQGSEYPAVIIPILTQHFVMLSRNLLYTAVTRGKRLVVLIADPRAIGIALAETRREQRRTYLAQRIADRVR